MPKIRLRLLSAALAAALALCAAPGFTRGTPASAPQESVSLHLTLGNPSKATTSPRNKDNFLLVKPQFALSYNDSRGAPNWVSWHLEKSDIGTVERGNDFHPEIDLPSGFRRITPADYPARRWSRRRGAKMTCLLRP